MNKFSGARVRCPGSGVEIGPRDSAYRPVRCNYCGAERKPIFRPNPTQPWRRDALIPWHYPVSKKGN
jgi:DNA-directed RNA polymerase subunit RPC12/RpoP